MKKLLLVMVILLVSVALFAGLYVGAEAGYGFVGARVGAASDHIDVSLSVGTDVIGRLAPEFSNIRYPIIANQNLLVNLMPNGDFFNLLIGLNVIEYIDYQNINNTLFMAGPALKTKFNFSDNFAAFIEAKTPLVWAVVFGGFDYQFLPFSSARSYLLATGYLATAGVTYSF